MKKNVSKFVYTLLLILSASGFAAFAYFNAGNSVNYYCPILQEAERTTLVHLSFVIFLIGAIGGFSICALIKSKAEDLCSAYQKRHENTAIASESDKALIKTLEAKIETLEAALRSALDNGK